MRGINAKLGPVHKVNDSFFFFIFLFVKIAELLI